MNKPVKLIFVPFKDEKPSIGMYVKVRTDNELGYRYSYIHHFFKAPLGKCFSSNLGELTSDGADFVGNIIEIVKPYFICEDNLNDGDLVLLPNGTIQKMSPTDMIDYLASESRATKKIIANPEQIGLIFSKENIEKTEQTARFYKTFGPSYIKDVLNGTCSIEMIGDKPFLLNKKVIIHIEEYTGKL